MRLLERTAVRVRRSKWLRKYDTVWNVLRPAYRKCLSLLGRGGIERVINGTDTIRVTPRLYNLTEEYEPAVWNQLMMQLRPGDKFADIGASIGIVTIAGAQRVTGTGRVWAFEPDPASCAFLRENVSLNQVAARVQVIEAIVSSSEGTLCFSAGLATESKVAHGESEEGFLKVRSVALDSFFKAESPSVIKIDVEGHELAVLRGAARLLSDANRAPRFVLIEIHPFAWNDEKEGAAILQLLTDFGYSVVDLCGRTVSALREYGHIIGTRPEPTDLK